MWKRIRAKSRAAWTKMKLWVYALLVSIGVITTITAVAVPVDGTYTRATTYDDGSSMPLSDIGLTRIYCDGLIVSEEAGADEDWDADMLPGTYTCYGTHVDIFQRESIPSPSIQKQVFPTGLPNPPILDEN